MSKRRRRSKLGLRRMAPPGSPPGTVAVDPDSPRPVVHFMGYGPDGVEECEITDLAQLDQLRGKWPVIWVDVAGLGDGESLQRIGRLFDLHPLALEDVVHTDQRSKVELYGESWFIVTRTFTGENNLESEQLALFIGRGFVLTFQERVGDCFDPVRARIRSAMGRLSTQGADYLAYALLDAVVDHYFPLLERYAERIERLDQEVLAAPQAALVQEIQAMRYELLVLQRAVRPLREEIGALIHDVTGLITPPTRVFLRDAQDHTIRLIELVEQCREMSGGLIQLYLSAMTQRTNEAMRVLTMIATIFIPLSFIAGIYGMNFDPDASPWNMPELRWVWGYPFAMGVMLVVALVLVGYFRRQGWIGRGGRKARSTETR